MTGFEFLGLALRLVAVTVSVVALAHCRLESNRVEEDRRAREVEAHQATLQASLAALRAQHESATAFAAAFAKARP